jgi:aspartyl-tRNA(Asn)/glutamyl-tRNA(Gln) amidotransferase subunit C
MKMKIDKNEIVRLANSIMFALDEETVDLIHENSEVFMDHVERVMAIDTKDLEGQYYPFEEVSHFLRDDIVGEVITYEEAFKNAPKVEGDFFEVIQVVDK